MSIKYKMPIMHFPSHQAGNDMKDELANRRGELRAEAEPCSEGGNVCYQ